MLKNELINTVASTSGESRDTVRKVLDSAASVATIAIAAGKPVHLFGLGKLTITKRGAKVARNIRTGEQVVVPPRKAILFKASVSLTDAANAS